MKKILALFSLLFVMTACGPEQLEEGKPVYVTVSTNMGDVTVMLYDDTPLHRDNFIKLCQDNAYEGVLFHRVIKEFVVQGGDPTVKPMNQVLYMAMVMAVIQCLPKYYPIISISVER